MYLGGPDSNGAFAYALEYVKCELKALRALITGISQTNIISTKVDLGLDNVDNTSDLSKPISTDTKNYIDYQIITSGSNVAAEATTRATADTSLGTLKADKTAISNIDNTSDINKPVSLAQQQALDLKASITYVNSSVSGINASVAGKADVTYVDSGLSTKANTSDVTTSLALKTDLSTFNTYQTSNDSSVALKANTSDVNTSLALKADAAATTTSLGLKLDLVKKPIITTVAGLRTQSVASDVIYQTTDLGGGQWYYDSTDTTSTDNTGTVVVTGTSQRLKRILSNDYFVKWFGAKGDGATDETTLLNSIIQSVPSGANLIFETGKVYNISSIIIIDKPLTVIGNGARFNLITADGIAISLRSSNISLNGLQVNGVGNASFVDNAELIITENSSEAVWYDNIKIENCTVYNNTKAGITLHFITNFTISNNTLYDFPYHGIMVLSGKGGVIKGNNINNIHATGSPSSNAYGISASAQGITNVNNISSDVLISENTITNIPTWAGIDSHGGQNLTIFHNKVTNCKWAITIVSYVYAVTVAANNIKISENTLVCNSATINAIGITVDVAVTGLFAKTIITNNQLISGNIVVSNTESSIIDSNVISQPNGLSGIKISNSNYKLNITNNIVIDAWDVNGSNNTGAIIIGSGSLMDGFISGNVLKRTSFTPPNASQVNSYGFMQFTTGIGTKIIFGENDFSIAVVSEYYQIEQPVILRGNGSPNAVKPAVVGSMYKRLNGAIGTTLYIKEVGTDSNGWTPIASGAPTKSTMQVEFGANVITGTLDWNDLSNTLPGSTNTALQGTATNGSGDSGVFHPFNFEYSSKDGSGNITQFAIPYATSGTAVWYRGRFSGTWNGWRKLLDSSNFIAGTNYLAPSALTSVVSTLVPYTGATADINLGSFNVIIGASNYYYIGSVKMLYANVTLFNYFVGAAGNATMTGTFNIGSGIYALYANTTGSYNNANGGYSLSLNTTGSNNVANGYQALKANTTGINNTSNGSGSAFSNTTGGNNTANGYYSLFSNISGNYNTASGGKSLYSNTAGISNTANGYYALYGVIGNGNTGSGYQCLYSTTGDYNSAIGYSALYGNTVGANNNAFGGNAGKTIADGSTSNTSGTYNLFLGSNTKSLTATDTYETVIGAGAIGLGSHSVKLGGNDVTLTQLTGKVNLYTAPLDAVGNFLTVTSGGDVSSRTAAEVLTDTGALSKVGTTTNDNAATGNVGEHIASAIAIGSAISLTTATAANITSISLTAGDWDVSANINYNETTATVTQKISGVNTTTAALPIDGSEVYNGNQVTTGTVVDGSSIERKRISIATTTTVYLVGQATFSAGTVTAFGKISARRVR